MNWMDWVKMLAVGGGAIEESAIRSVLPAVSEFLEFPEEKVLLPPSWGKVGMGGTGAELSPPPSSIDGEGSGMPRGLSELCLSASAMR
jgi:hypothetical protein